MPTENSHAHAEHESESPPFAARTCVYVNLSVLISVRDDVILPTSLSI